MNIKHEVSFVDRFAFVKKKRRKLRDLFSKFSLLQINKPDQNIKSVSVNMYQNNIQ